MSFFSTIKVAFVKRRFFTRDQTLTKKAKLINIFCNLKRNA